MLKNLLSFLVIFAIFPILAGAQNIGSLKNTVTPGFSFAMDMRLGDTDTDVRELQRVLNASVDTVVSLDGEGSSGKETTYFGSLTKNAVIKFQTKYRDSVLTPYGLTSGDGIVNKATRTKLNLLIGVMNTSDSVGSPQGRASSGGSATKPVSTPVVTVTSPTTSAASQAETCNFVELLISIEAITSANANPARSALGCPTVLDTTKPFVDIKADGKNGPITVIKNSQITLSWTSEGMVSCAAGTKNKPLAGSEKINLGSESGSFVLSCRTASGSTYSDSVTVNIAGEPAATSTMNFANPNLSTSTNPYYSTQIPTSTSPYYLSRSDKKTITGPADVSKLIGYGVVNDWMNIDSASLASQLAINNLTVTDMELFGLAEYGYYEKPQVLAPKLKTFITNMRAQGVTTFINMSNWNKGENPATLSICDARFNDAWFNSVLDMVITASASSTNPTASSTDMIILQAASEWSSNNSTGGRNSQCFDKAQRWENILATRWTGMKSSNMGTRPASAIKPDWFFEYHPCSLEDLGSSGSIVTTDCGGAIKAINAESSNGFADTKVLKAYACQVRQSGDKGFMYYGYDQTQIDSNAIIALGQVASADAYTSCDEIAAEEAEAPAPTTQFAGYVKSVEECNPINESEHKLWQAVVAPCKAGDFVAAGAESGGYIVIREGINTVPSAGDSVVGYAVHDGGTACTNAPAGSGEYIGTVSGAFDPQANSGCAATEGGVAATDGHGNSLWVDTRNGALQPGWFLVPGYGNVVGGAVGAVKHIFGW